MKKEIKIIIIIAVVIIVVSTRAWLFILDKIVNLIKKIFKLGTPSTHKWHIKKNKK